MSMDCDICGIRVHEADHTECNKLRELESQTAALERIETKLDNILELLRPLIKNTSPPTNEEKEVEDILDAKPQEE